MSNEPALTFDQTAALMAHVAYFGGKHLSEILKRKSVPPDEWEASSEHWQKRMLDAAAAREFDVLNQFNGTFGDIKQRLEDEEIRLEDIGPLPEELDDTATGAPAVEKEPTAPPVEPEPEPPPEVHAPPAVPPGVPLATALGSPPPAATSPWARSTPTSPRPPAEAPRVAPPSPDVTADAVPAVAAELPFDGPSQIPAPAAPSVAAEGQTLAGGTSFVSALSDDQLEPSTPFGSGSPLPADVEGTAFMMAPFEDEPLPFEGENPAPPPAVDDIAHEAAGATSFVPAVEVSASAPMSPEAYARLVHATYEQPPSVREAVHQSHQLDEATRAQLDAAMARYMKRQPEAFRVYMQWVHHLRRGGA